MLKSEHPDFCGWRAKGYSDGRLLETPISLRQRREKGTGHILCLWMRSIAVATHSIPSPFGNWETQGLLKRKERKQPCSALVGKRRSVMNGCRRISSPNDTLSTSCQNKGCCLTWPAANIYTNTPAGRRFFPFLLDLNFSRFTDLQVYKPSTSAVQVTWFSGKKLPPPIQILRKQPCFCTGFRKARESHASGTSESLIKLQCLRTTK